MSDQHIENVNHLKKKLDKGVSFEKTMHILYKLQKIPISVKLLTETGIGFKLRELSKKEKNNDVGKTAKLLIMAWKQVLKNSEEVEDENESGDERKNHDNRNNSSSSFEMDKEEHRHRYRDRNNRHKKDYSNSDDDNNANEEEMDADNCDETRSEASVSPQCASSSSHKKKHKKKKKKFNKDNDSDNEQEKREKRKEKKRKHRENDTDSIHDVKKIHLDCSSKVNNKCDIKADKCDNQQNMPQSSELKFNNKLEPKMNRSQNGIQNNRLYNLNNDMFSAMLNMNDHLINSKSKTSTSNSLNRINRSNGQSFNNQVTTNSSNLEKEIIRSCQQANRYDPSFYQYYQPQKLENNLEQPQVNMAGMKFKGRTQVYAGLSKLVTVSEVYRLQDICIRVLMNHVDKIYEVGDLPYFILKPVFAKCTVQQLRRIEYHNPQLLEETDELWREFCEKDFKNKQKGRDKFKSWRDFYNYLVKQREVKLKNITENINSKQRQAIPERKTMQIDLKTPREILRRRERISTTNSLYPCKTSTGNLKMNMVASKPKPAPLMKKLLQIRQSKMRR